MKFLTFVIFIFTSFLLILESKAITDSFPKLRAAELTVKVKDQSVITRRVDVSRGMPNNPVSLADIEAKFRSLSAGVLSLAQQNRIIECIRSMDAAESLAAISGFLSI